MFIFAAIRESRNYSYICERFDLSKLPAACAVRFYKRDDEFVATLSSVDVCFESS